MPGRRGRYRLTVRNGSEVSRERPADLEQTLERMQEAVDEIRSGGGLDRVKMLRTFEPGDRVAGRVEISSGGLFRGADAGIDVMGDGRLIAYSGGVGRRELSSEQGASALELVREQLERLERD